MDPDDDHLVRRCLDGDQGAFETLLQRYQTPVFNAALRLVRDREDAGDITQITFLKAFENLRRFDPRFRFFSWIYRIAINEALNHLQRQRPSRPVEDGDAPATAGPDRDVERGEVERQVQDAMMVLSPDQRTVLVLRHFLELSYREIGETLEIPDKTVKSRLFSARLRLRDVLESRGVFSR